MTNRSAWTKIAVGGGLLCGIGEVMLSPTMDGLAGAGAALFFGAIFLAGAAWLWRGSSWGAVVIGIFAVIELAFMPVYERNTGFEWATQGLFAAASAIALAGSLGTLVERRRRRHAPSQATA